MVWEFSKFQEKGRASTKTLNYFKKIIKVTKNQLYVLKLVFIVSFNNLKFLYLFIDLHTSDFSGNVNV